MSRVARIQILVAALGLIAGLGILWLIVASNHESTSNAVMALYVLIGWMFMGPGLVAWRRRPDSRFGILFAAVGFAWAAAGISEANNAAVFSFGLLLDSLWIAILIHAILAFPSGSLNSRLARGVTIGFYGAATVLQLALVLVSRSRELGDCPLPGCPENLLLVRHSAALHNAVQTTFAAVASALGFLALVVLARRWREASPPLRRTLAPVFVAGAAFVVLSLMVSLAQISFGFSETLARVLFLTTFAALPLAFLAGLIRGRLAHAAVSRLVVELRQHVGASSGVRDALARNLRDPSLDLAYWIPDANGYVDTLGRSVDPNLESGRATTVVRHGSQPIATLIHDPSLLEDPALVDAACAAAGIALTNERLQAELRRRVEELRASRTRIVEAGDAERRRLERNLHDGAQQRLVSLALSNRLAEATVRRDPAEAERILGAASKELSAALTELREIARGIHPGVLSDRGLEPALRALADREPLPVELDCDIGNRLPQPVEAAAYYVVAEALTNVAKYAEASVATVHVARENANVTVLVVDDGIGGADATRGTGLRGLRDRVEALDGTLAVESAPGSGTTIRATIPLPAPR